MDLSRINDGNFDRQRKRRLAITIALVKRFLILKFFSIENALLNFSGAEIKSTFD